MKSFEDFWASIFTWFASKLFSLASAFISVGFDGIAVSTWVSFDFPARTSSVEVGRFIPPIWKVELISLAKGFMFEFWKVGLVVLFADDFNPAL